jgi:hypothetical protein
MSIPRRKFLKTGIMVAALAGIPLKEAISFQRSGNPHGLNSALQIDELGFFNMSTFTPYVNTKFRIYQSSANSIVVTLVKVEDLAAASGRKSASGGECFSLQFTGPRTKQFKQNTYKIEHPALGTFHMFVTPISRNTNGVINYEAIINRCVG